ncbi:MAG: methyl-accepting chemotaxis protein, partial [Treponema sp.]|nr:methyl-accepting chemotaxis protein [Treponema sp.]
MKKRAFSLPLGFLVFFLLAAVILPAGLLILLTYQGASALLVEQAGGSYRELLSLKQQEIDHRLLVAGVFLDNLVSSNNQDFLIARFTTDRNRYMHTKYAIYRSVIDHIPMIGNIDFFYFYNRRFDDDMMISVNSQFRAENEMLRRDLTSMYAAEQTLLQWWHCEKRTGGYYLLRSYISDTVMIVLGINLAHLLPELPEAAGGDKGFFFFADPRSRVLVSGSAGHSGLPLPGNTGEGGNRGVLQKPSAYGIYTLGLSFNRQELYQQLPATVRFGFLGITLIILAVIVFVYVLLNRLVLHPISLAASVMDRVGFGEMDERLPERVLSRELTLMNRSFNQMLEKITALRMNVY